MIQHKLGLPIVQLFSSGSLIPPKVQFLEERWLQNEQAPATKKLYDIKEEQHQIAQKQTRL